MSSYLPDIAGLDYDWEAAKEMPVLVQHGSEDPLIPVARGRALALSPRPAGPAGGICCRWRKAHAATTLRHTKASVPKFSGTSNCPLMIF